MNFFRTLLILRAWVARHLFMLFVAIPTLGVAFYLYCVATDVYVSESRFVVRGDSPGSSFSMTDLLGASGLVMNTDESVTKTYLLSREALKSLEDKGIREIFGKGDIFGRFPEWGEGDSFEDLFSFYEDMTDAQASIGAAGVTLKTYAFTAEDARYLNEELLKLGEKFVARMNERVQQDKLQRVNEEIAEVEKYMQESAKAFSRYVAENSVRVSSSLSVPTMNEITRAQNSLSELKLKLLNGYWQSADKKELSQLRKQMDSLESQVSSGYAQLKLAFPSQPEIAEYARLKLEKDYAEKLLANAKGWVKSAQAGPEKSQLHFDRVLQPSLPDDAMGPSRAWTIALTLFFGLLAWILASVVGALWSYFDWDYLFHLD